MTPLSALGAGMRRVNRAPAILAGVWALTMLVSLPLTLGLRGILEQHLGGSLAADTAANGVDYDWMLEFGDQTTGVGVTFRPTIIGFGAVMDNLSAFLDNVHQPVAIVSAAAVYMVLWIAIAGGIIDRYARDRATRAHGFFAASGGYFFRFLRLAVLMWIVYACLFAYLHPWLFDRLYPRWVYETTVERTAFLLRATLYLAFGLLVGACNLIFDYAKVRTVVEDRWSMLAAVAGAVRFIWRNLGAAVALYAADVLLFLAIVAAYAAVAPGAGGGGWSVWWGLVVSQLYVLARLWVKLVFWASETALYQGRLGHAQHVASPLPRWPESPAVEAIGPR